MMADIKIKTFSVGLFVNRVFSLALVIVGDFIDYIVCGLDCTDIAVQMAVTYICVQLYNKTPGGSTCLMAPDAETTQHVVQSVMQTIQNTSNNDLLVNLLGKNFLSNMFLIYKPPIKLIQLIPR